MSGNWSVKSASPTCTWRTTLDGGKTYINYVKFPTGFEMFPTDDSDNVARFRPLLTGAVWKNLGLFFPLNQSLSATKIHPSLLLANTNR